MLDGGVLGLEDEKAENGGSHVSILIAETIGGRGRGVDICEGQ